MRLPRLRIGGNHGLPVVRSRDHPGIRLRISTPDGIVLEADSNELFYRAAIRNLTADGKDRGRWFDLIAGGDAGTTDFSTVPLKIEVKPVRLAEVPE